MNTNRRPILRLAAGLSMAGLMCFCSSPAIAGDMDGLGYAIFLMEIYWIVAVVVSLVGLLACGRIHNRLRRALARLVIVIIWYTPVLYDAGYQHIDATPAFMLFLSDFKSPGTGLFGHSLLLAYALTAAMTIPIVLLWFWIDNRYLRARSASQIQRASVTSSATAQTPPT